jgi:hypothetical protein
MYLVDKIRWIINTFYLRCFEKLWEHLDVFKGTQRLHRSQGRETLIKSDVGYF